MFDEQKFWANVDKSANDGCWIWQGKVLKHGYGYGGLPPSRHFLAHHVAYELTYGEVESGFKFNACPKSRLCVNPSHITVSPKITPLAERFWQKVQKSDGCWLWQGTQNGRGYGTIFVKRGQSHVLAHRLSYEIHYGQVPAGLVVMHLCDNPTCVNPSHLRAGTTQENIQDCVQKGRRNDVGLRGEESPRSVLSESDVLFIRENSPKYSLAQLAKMFGVSEGAISHIRARRSWKHI